MNAPRIRPRRLRNHANLRAIGRDAGVTPDRLVAPLFVCAGEGVRREVPSMPGVHVRSVDTLVTEVEALRAAGVTSLLLFGVPDPTLKDEEGSEAWNPDGPVPCAIRALKHLSADLSIWADVCLCAFTSHGHCGVAGRGPGGAFRVDNDRTLPLLARTATCYARAGADVVAPSDMMDARVRAIRDALDEADQIETAICSYAVKFASSFYGPFRDAAASTPAEGDRRGYQLDPGNVRDAMREAALDIEEGADLILIKPALPYLDIVRRVRSRVSVPIVAYQVSGEFAMIKAAAERGWLDERAIVAETLTAIRRAGADAIVTYFAREAAAIFG